MRILINNLNSTYFLFLKIPIIFKTLVIISLHYEFGKIVS